MTQNGKQIASTVIGAEKNSSTKNITAWLPLRTAFGTMLLPLLLTLPALVQAQYDYTTNNGTITITDYTGSGGAVTIPGKIDGLPVTSIGNDAFFGCYRLTSVTFPNSVTSIGIEAFAYCNLASLTIPTRVTSIGYEAFAHCTSLTSVTLPTSVTSIGDGMFSSCSSLINVTIPTSVTSIGNEAFWSCTSLASVTLPASVTSIGGGAFSYCTSLASVTLPTSVTNIEQYAFSGCTSLASVTLPTSVTTIGYEAFAYCTNLAGVYFKGNAPFVFSSVFTSANNATVYYLPGTTGWDSTFAGCPTKLWNLPVPPQVQTSDVSFGVRTNRFGFTVTGTSNSIIVVEACTDPGNPVWLPLQTNSLSSDSLYFSDPQWTHYSARFYRLRSP